MLHFSLLKVLLLAADIDRGEKPLALYYNSWRSFQWSHHATSLIIYSSCVKSLKSSMSHELVLHPSWMIDQKTLITQFLRRGQPVLFCKMQVYIVRCDIQQEHAERYDTHNLHSATRPILGQGEGEKGMKWQ